MFGLFKKKPVGPVSQVEDEQAKQAIMSEEELITYFNEKTTLLDIACKTGSVDADKLHEFAFKVRQNFPIGKLDLTSSGINFALTVAYALPYYQSILKYACTLAHSKNYTRAREALLVALDNVYGMYSLVEAVKLWACLSEGNGGLYDNEVVDVTTSDMIKILDDLYGISVSVSFEKIISYVAATLIEDNKEAKAFAYNCSESEIENTEDECNRYITKSLDVDWLGRIGITIYMRQRANVTSGVFLDWRISYA